MVGEDGVFITGLPISSDRRWEIRRKAVVNAVKYSKESAPGPDGIPTAAYKRLGRFAVDILHAALERLCKPEGIHELTTAYQDRSWLGCHDFNLSLLCCLPKKVSGTDPLMGEYYGPENTRPLALVNVDNRIIASAARLTWEPLLAGYISDLSLIHI